MRASLDRRVRERAGHRCEYCRLPQSASRLTFPIDHIIARQHQGPSILDNLALSCLHCNVHKGPNIAGLDEDNGGLTPLFHPRRERWTDHFRWSGITLVGLSPVGRVTIQVLAMNDDLMLAVRQALQREGDFPPLERSPPQ